MPEFVRVKDKETGHHVSVSQQHYDLNPDAWQVLSQPASAPDGTPLPPKYKTTASAEAAKKNTDAAKSADTKEQ